MDVGRCLGMPNSWELRQGARLRHIEIEDCSDSKRKCFQVLHLERVLPEALWGCMIHRGCSHNEIRGLVGRVLGSVPEPDPVAMATLRKAIRHIGWKLSARSEFERLDYHEFADAYSGSKRTKYLAAADSLVQEPIEQRDARVNAFVKSEKRPIADEKDPRIIQFRSPRYTLALGTFLKPMEHALLGYKGNTRVGHRSRVIAKGLNSWQHAALIKRKFNEFGSTRVLSIDASRFDKHVSVEALRAEHGLWRMLNRDPELAMLLSWQCHNRGTTMHGTKYEVIGNRMSGDYNTGAGNCVLMAGMVEALMRPLSCPFDYLTNSDDCLIFVEATDLDRVRDLLPTAFLAFGHEIKLDSVADKLEDVVHCQQRPMKVDGRFRMVRDWKKVLSTMLCSDKHYHNPRGGMRVMKSVAQCELVLNSGVPILQPLCLRILELLKGFKYAKLDPRDTVVYRALQEVGGEDEWTKVKAIPITLESRVAFADTFGVGLDEQRHIEDVISKISYEDIDLNHTLGFTENNFSVFDSPERVPDLG